MPFLAQPLDLDILLETAPDTQAALEIQMGWLMDILDWVKRTGLEGTGFDFEGETKPLARLRYFFNLLEHNPHWKLKVAQLCRTLAKEFDFQDLNLHLAPEQALLLDPQVANQISGLLCYQTSQEEADWCDNWIHQLRDFFLSLPFQDTATRLGERYITRTKAEYLDLIRKAVCGGLLMALMTVFKFSILTFPIAFILKTLLAGLNYSTTFLGIHFFQFTLGTKQPALTASTLASRMAAEPESVCDEMIHVIRSQMAAIVGNILGVIPVVALISWISHTFFHQPVVGAEKAWHIVNEFSIFGPTPLYAYFTGVLLWCSSVLAGQFEKWFWRQSFTSRFQKSVVRFFQAHAFAIAANVILGFLLAIVPAFFHNLGIQLDVRHVTLSSGSLTLAVLDLPNQALITPAFWLAVLGILSMAFLNVTVCFGLTLAFAVRKQKVQTPQRKVIYKILFKRIWAKPMTLFWPER